MLLIRQNAMESRIEQLPVGGCMLVSLGIFCGENMQIEGFWYDLFSGAFEAAAIHCAASKIFRPLLFGRGWCDWACRTAMVLDFLPWKVPKSRKRLFFGWLRCAVFADSLTFVTVFLMPMSCFALLRVKCHKTKCTGCGKCRQVCPMDVDVTDNTPKQEKSCVLPAPEPARTAYCEGKTESSQMKILPECQSRPLYTLISL